MTKRELMEVRRLRVEIVQQEDYLIGLRGLMWSMENQLRQGRSCSISKQVEALTVKIVYAEERLQWLYERLEAAKVELRIRITAETNNPLLMILIRRYIECKTWTEVSKAMGMSRREVYRLHKKFASQLDAH